MGGLQAVRFASKEAAAAAAVEEEEDLEEEQEEPDGAAAVAKLRRRSAPAALGGAAGASPRLPPIRGRPPEHLRPAYQAQREADLRAKEEARLAKKEARTAGELGLKVTGGRLGLAAASAFAASARGGSAAVSSPASGGRGGKAAVAAARAAGTPASQPETGGKRGRAAAAGATPADSALLAGRRRAVVSSPAAAEAGVGAKRGRPARSDPGDLAAAAGADDDTSSGGKRRRGVGAGAPSPARLATALAAVVQSDLRDMLEEEEVEVALTRAVRGRFVLPDSIRDAACASLQQLVETALNAAMPDGVGPYLAKRVRVTFD